MYILLYTVKLSMAMGLNCVGPLILRFFHQVHTKVLQNPWLVELSLDYL